jgi:hypothetical protein
MAFVDHKYNKKSKTNDLTLNFILAQDADGKYVVIEDRDGALPQQLTAVALDGIYGVTFAMKFKEFDDTQSFTFTEDDISRLTDSDVGDAVIVPGTGGDPDKVQFQITDNETQTEGRYVGTIKLNNLSDAALTIDMLVLTTLVFEDDFTERIPVSKLAVLSNLGISLNKLSPKVGTFLNRAVQKGVSIAYTKMPNEVVQWFRQNSWDEHSINMTEELCTLYLHQYLYPEPPEPTMEMINDQLGHIQSITIDRDNDGSQDMGKGPIVNLKQSTRAR